MNLQGGLNLLLLFFHSRKDDGLRERKKGKRVDLGDVGWMYRDLRTNLPSTANRRPVCSISILYPSLCLVPSSFEYVRGWNIMGSPLSLMDRISSKGRGRILLEYIRVLKVSRG